MLHTQATEFVESLDEAGEKLMRGAFERLGLTGRSHDRILRMARTIADLAGEETIGRTQIAEALAYRTLDQKYWYENRNC